MKLLKGSCSFILAFIVAAAPLHAAVKAFDHSLWDSFLKKYVNGEGEVDYSAVKKDPSALLDYLKLTSQGEPPKFREEGIAFWMNVYNAGVIRLVLEHYPVTNVQKIPGFWDITVIQTATYGIVRGADGSQKVKRGKKQYSLNGIRIKELIKTYHDEKIHLALSCGARGCPPLQRQAFTGENVEGRLFLAARSFVNDPKEVEIVPGKKKIKLSKILEWYGKDFNLDFGTPEKIGKFTNDEMSVLSFLAYYLEDEAKVEYLEEGRYKIDYLPFDWSLNDWKNNPSAVPSPPEEGAALPVATSSASLSKKT